MCGTITLANANVPFEKTKLFSLHHNLTNAVSNPN